MGTPDPLDRLARAVEERVLPDSDRYTLGEVADRAGTDVETARRLWRALGFADPSPGDRVAGDLDVEVLRRGMELTDTGDGIETLVRQTRIMSAAVARITELWVDQIRVALDAGDPDLLDQAEEAFADQDRMMWILGYMHRRLFAAALRRELADRATGTGVDRCTVVFVDLVGFTTLTERLGPLELSDLIGTFEAAAYDTVAEHGGRVVKTIGDEVLFFAADPATGLHITEDLLRRAGDDGLPPMRAGIEHGPAHRYEGDLYGRAVNRAARVVAEATPGALAATATVRDAVPDRAWVDLGTRHLKGLGPTALWGLDLAGAAKT